MLLLLTEKEITVIEHCAAYDEAGLKNGVFGCLLEADSAILL